MPTVSNAFSYSQLPSVSRNWEVREQREPVETFVRTGDNPESQINQLRAFANAPALIEGEEFTRAFPGREGYDEDFLGTSLSLPTLDPEIEHLAAPLLTDPESTELEYTNFSIVMNKERRQAFFTALNIDGEKMKQHRRSGDWAIDGRLAREHQLGNEAYRSNPWDRGHLVRRSATQWGPHSKRAGEDSFVFTNAALQHKDLNQKEWLDLENHILDHARASDEKLTVFTGPIFSEEDPFFDNNGRMDEPEQIPQEFFKVAVWKDEESGELKSASFVMSQKRFMEREDLFKGLPTEPFQMYQVSLEELESRTQLDFGDIGDVGGDRQAIDDLQQVKV